MCCFKSNSCAAILIHSQVAFIAISDCLTQYVCVCRSNNANDIISRRRRIYTPGVWMKLNWYRFVLQFHASNCCEFYFKLLFLLPFPVERCMSCCSALQLLLHPVLRHLTQATDCFVDVNHINVFHFEALWPHHFCCFGLPLSTESSVTARKGWRWRWTKRTQWQNDASVGFCVCFITILISDKERWVANECYTVICKILLHEDCGPLFHFNETHQIDLCYTISGNLLVLWHRERV